MVSDYIFFISILSLFSISIFNIIHDRTIVYDQLISLKNNNLNAASNFNAWFHKHNTKHMCNNIIIKNKLGFCNKTRTNAPCNAFIYNDTELSGFVSETFGCSIHIIDDSKLLNEWLDSFSLTYVDILILPLKNNADWIYLKSWENNSTHTYDKIYQLIIHIPSIITNARAQIIYDIDIFKNPFYLSSDKKSFNVSFI
jgi:hypothetical protein